MIMLTIACAAIPQHQADTTTGSGTPGLDTATPRPDTAHPTDDSAVAEELPRGSSLQGIVVDDPTHGVLDRTYGLHVPGSVDASQATPLLVALHGTAGTAFEMAANTGFVDLADEHGFIAVFGQGMGYNDGQGKAFVDQRLEGTQALSTGWNAGDGAQYSAVYGIDDIVYLETVLAEVGANFDISDTFVAGFSNGGGMTQIFTTARPDVVSGTALVSCALKPVEEQPPPTPVVVFRGTADDVVPFSQGPSTAESMITTLSGVNDCDSYEEATLKIGEATVTHRGYTGCSAATELYAVHGGEHRWYASSSPVIWSFLSNL